MSTNLTQKIHNVRLLGLTVVKHGKTNLGAFASYPDVWSALQPSLAINGLSVGFSAARITFHGDTELVSMDMAISDGADSVTWPFDMIVPERIMTGSGKSVTNNAQRVASAESYLRRTADLPGLRHGAPVRLDDVVFAEMLWAAFKSLFTSVVILAVMLALNISHSPMLLLALPLLALVGITFSCIALIFNALAKGYDFFTYYFTLFLTPTMFLSGVFFPRDQLPGVLRVISDWLPLTAAVELIRPLFLGQWPAQGLLHLAVLVTYAVAGFWLALGLTRKRFRS